MNTGARMSGYTTYYTLLFQKFTHTNQRIQIEKLLGRFEQNLCYV